MKLIISSRGITVGDRLNAELEKKFSKLDKYFTPDQEAAISLSKEGDMAKIEANLETKLGHIKAAAADKDLDKAIDAVCDNIKSQMKKMKEKIVDKKHSAESLGKSMVEDEEETE